MKKVIAHIIPFIEKEKDKLGLAGKSNREIVMVTVKGNILGIGKNIVGLELGCNSYDIIYSGVMVYCDKILSSTRYEKADVFGLSGLITPSF